MPTVTASFLLAISAAAFLVGIAIAVLAMVAPDLPEALRDLRRRPALPSDDRTSLQVERAISRRLFGTLTLVGIVAVVIAAFVILVVA